MSTSLFLYPLPPLEKPPEMRAVIEPLRQAGFLGKSLDENRYAVGEGFFNCMTFAGCSPHLRLDPPVEGDWRFCHVQIHASERPRLRMTPHRGRPRCPVCRAGLADWKKYLDEWKQDASQKLGCVSCGANIAVAELDWRQYGMAARCSVEIHQVYPGEALPQDGLLQLLGKLTGRDWAYAWAESRS
ncbi:hypothetical protein [Thiolapillus sp.]